MREVRELVFLCEYLLAEPEVWGDSEYQVWLADCVTQLKERVCDMASADLTKSDLTVELWREYDFGGRVYRIDNPVELWTRPGGTTHRVVDANGVAHCMPAPGQQGCVLRWKQKDGLGPVSF